MFQTKQELVPPLPKPAFKPNLIPDLSKPDTLPPNFLTEILADVATSSDNLLHQYTRHYGHPRLVDALAGLYSPILGRSIDSQAEILVTPGAHGAIYSSILGHVDVGDEVVIIEPFLENYEKFVILAGGIPRFTPLEELERVLTPKTKMIILSNPLHPFGKLIEWEDLRNLASLCHKWNVICLADERFEWACYNSKGAKKLGSLPAMWEKTISVGSASGTFMVEGWRVGWVLGPRDILANVKFAHQQTYDKGNTPLQEAIGVAIERELGWWGRDDCYFEMVPRQLRRKRDLMVRFLREMGLEAFVPDAGLFMVVEWSHSENLGLEVEPLSRFYSEEHEELGKNCVVISFAKSDETLKIASKGIRKWRKEYMNI